MRKYFNKNFAVVMAGLAVGAFGGIGGVAGVVSLVDQNHEGCRATQTVVHNLDDFITASEHRSSINHSTTAAQKAKAAADDKATIKALGQVKCN
jgi:hypothetical protein